MKTDSVPLLKLCLAALIMAFMQLPMSSQVQAEPDNPKLRNERCIRCHGKEDYSRKGADGQQRALHVNAEQYLQSIHGGQDCVSCHRDIVKIPHRKGIDRNVGCVKCHLDSWEEAQRGDIGQEHDRLRVVVEQIETYMNSVHARPKIDDQSRTNATCYDCHDAHYMSSVSSVDKPQNKLKNPYVCGSCHKAVLDMYMTSVHGKEIGMGNTAAAVCSDCHSAHSIERPDIVSGRLSITAQCGDCHEPMLESYLQTYHGKITQLGYGETAKCYDCHGSHGIKRVDEPESMVHNGNRLETCRSCHEDATQGYVTFEPHGTTDNFAEYPAMWIAKKGMIGLLLGTFAFFWLHSALWFYREYQDRKYGKDRPHIRIEDMDMPEGKTHFRRFTKWWRLAHLVGALSIMLLALTGLTVLFSGSAWAPYVMNLLGGPVSAGILHRIGAVGFMGVFFIHLFYFAYHIGRNWETFEWFGPNSLVPNWNDLGDAIAMFRWFFGLGPRPLLDHFSYWEKFDYWAPFWGMTIIGVSGMMMWFPDITAAYLPGWAFNVAAIVHGEEAILAVVFLFTVHFFNNHFRPDKFPLDTTMFTGRVPLEHYRHEHRREYDRLVASGELEKYLVDAPSEPMAAGSSILGTVLIAIGLTLLTLVALGFLGI
ncbi:MAG: cytochrome C [Gammaproteobacteria bacterium]|nr:cytochrome C [Gammaproteobacteria bacterium]